VTGGLRSVRPSLRLEVHNQNATASTWLRLFVILVGVTVGVLFLASQADPASRPFETMWLSTFGSAFGLSQVIVLATPLILAGCAVSVARRVGLWNIGVDGQLFFGGWFCSALAFSFPDLPGPVLTVGMLVAGAAGGAVWALVPALLRTYLRVNEIVTTLLLNFVASSWIVYWVTGPWANKGFQGAGSITSKPITDNASLPSTTIHSVAVGLDLAIALAVVVALGIAMRFTRWGLRTLIVGSDDEVARYAGLSVRRLRISTFLLSGAIGGLTGVILVLQVHNLSPDLSTKTGYFGIVVAVLAGRAVWGTIPMGILMGALVAMGFGLQLSGVDFGTSLVLTGILLVLAASADALARYRIVIALREPAHESAQERVAPEGGA
jgi:general nucleoside transport system permease protein